MIPDSEYDYNIVLNLVLNPNNKSNLDEENVNLVLFIW